MSTQELITRCDTIADSFTETRRIIEARSAENHRWKSDDLPWEEDLLMAQAVAVEGDTIGGA